MYRRASLKRCPAQSPPSRHCSAPPHKHQHSVLSRVQHRPAPSRSETQRLPPAAAPRAASKPVVITSWLRRRLISFSTGGAPVNDHQTRDWEWHHSTHWVWPWGDSMVWPTAISLTLRSLDCYLRFLAWATRHSCAVHECRD